MSTNPLQPSKVDLKELQQQQIEADGDLASAGTKVSGNVDSSYELPKHESHLIHLQLTRKTNDPAQKKYVTTEKVVTLSPAEYDRMEANGSFKEYDAQTILHDPRQAAVKKAAEGGNDTGKDGKKTLRTKADYVARYEELAADAIDLPEDQRKAPADATIEQLKSAIADLEAGATLD